MEWGSARWPVHSMLPLWSGSWSSNQQYLIPDQTSFDGTPTLQQAAFTNMCLSHYPAKAIMERITHGCSSLNCNPLQPNHTDCLHSVATLNSNCTTEMHTQNKTASNPTSLGLSSESNHAWTSWYWMPTLSSASPSSMPWAMSSAISCGSTKPAVRALPSSPGAILCKELYRHLGNIS